MAATNGGSWWGGPLVVALIVLGILKFFGGAKTDKSTSHDDLRSLLAKTDKSTPSGHPFTPASRQAPRTSPNVPPGLVGDPIAVARLKVSGDDGTAELVRLAQGMSEAEALAMGLGVILTGTDTYGARIRFTNTGNVPVRVYPENLSIHFGAESVGVTTINHPSFLQRGILQPGHYADGLVMYRARIDIGAAMRLVGGGLSYNDDSIRITYDP